MLCFMAQRIPHTPSDGSPSHGNAGIMPAVLREPDAAKYIGLSRAFLKKSRLFGRGPDFVRTNRTISYRLVDLDRWLEGHVVRLTT